MIDLTKLKFGAIFLHEEWPAKVVDLMWEEEYENKWLNPDNHDDMDFIAKNADNIQVKVEYVGSCDYEAAFFDRSNLTWRYPAQEEWIPLSDLHEPCEDICELDFEQLCSLRKQIRVGSLYVADYRNTFTTPQFASDIADAYVEWLGDGFPNEDSPEKFAEYVENYF